MMLCVTRFPLDSDTYTISAKLSQSVFGSRSASHLVRESANFVFHGRVHNYFLVVQGEPAYVVVAGRVVRGEDL